jgi:integrase
MGRKPTPPGAGRAALHHSGKYVVTTTQKQQGQRIVKTLYGNTPEEATRAHAVYVMALGVAPSPRLEFSIWLHQYLQHHTRDLARSTLENYKAYLKRILPTLGTMRLEDITPWVLRPFFESLSNLSSSTRQHMFDFLNACFKEAVNLDVLDNNPMRGVKRPKTKVTRESQMWDVEDVVKLLKAFEGHRLAPVLHLCFTLGLRIGEALALTWQDFKGDYIEVRHTINTYYKKGDEPFRPCKWGSSRPIALDPETRSILEAHHLEQIREQGNRKDWNPLGLLFCSQAGTLYNPSNLRRVFQAKVRQAGIKYHSTHSMRKTYASLAALHLPIQDVQARLGHSDPRMTLKVYAKSYGSRNARAAVPLAALLGGDAR